MENIIDGILEREGWPKYTNDPDDAGGPTKGGVTLAALEEYWGRPVSVLDLMNLSEADARAFYGHRHIIMPRFAEIADANLRIQTIDCGVLHGVRRAGRFLQRARGGLKIDGRVGPQTLRAVNQAAPMTVSIRLANIRIRFIGRLVSANARARARGATTLDRSKYANGWLVRATLFSDEALPPL